MERALLSELAERHGLSLLGVAPADPLPEARQHLAEAVAAGRMGMMGWMGGERPEIAMGVMKVLTRRLRETSRKS